VISEAGSSSTGNLPGSTVAGDWPTALAPMQDVTGLPFMQVIGRRGSPDFFFTEFIRVHAHSRIDPEILSSIVDKPDDRPVFAQLIGENLNDLGRVARELNSLPVAGVDLNLGCPAPRVYRKNVGGGLLRDPEKIRQILDVLGEAGPSLLSVKMRIGFEDDRFFEPILGIIAESGVGLVSIHARTVRGGYQSEPSYRHVAKAVGFLPCPVLLNGSVETARHAVDLREETGVHGIMIGRSAIRNPWVFRQIRELQSGREIFRPKLRDLYGYVEDLYRSLDKPGTPEIRLVARMKKFLNYVGLSVDSEGGFLHAMRRSKTRSELFGICEEYMKKQGRADEDYSLEPFAHLARPKIKSCSGGLS
jgi:tRNA-dihydrouridine synthase B